MALLQAVSALRHEAQRPRAATLPVVAGVEVAETPAGIKVPLPALPIREASLWFRQASAKGSERGDQW
jgi:hypothetical protein